MAKLTKLTVFQIMDYNQAVEYLYNSLPVFHNIGAAAYKPGLENSIRLMNEFGNPQNRYRIIHVAGTNGKGSVSHFLSAILQSAGYKTGLYTSPHLVDFGERIRVDGKMISQEYVIDFVKNNKELLTDIKPSFFETTMAMAFKYFADCEVDVAVIEVGLGGRLDSTNIITPELSVITNISFDHMQFLGDTLEKIAAEKAGIIKPNIPVVIGETLPETKPVFVEKAKNENAEIIFSEEIKYVEFIGYEEDKMILNTPDYENLRVGLTGEYQLKNIATVLTCVDELLKRGFAIFEDDIRNGLEYVSQLTGLQGRWQILQKNPTVILDTGHNKAGIEFVVNQLKSLKYNRLHIVIGMVNDKDISAVLALLPKDAVYYFTNANIERALSAEKLKEQAEKYNLQGNVYSSVEQGVKTALETAEKNDLIFIGGSNFVVGEALVLFTHS